jgi:hypothetical protein
MTGVVKATTLVALVALASPKLPNAALPQNLLGPTENAPAMILGV